MSKSDSSGVNDIVIVVLSLLLYHRRVGSYSFCLDRKNDTIHPISCRCYQEDRCLQDVFKGHPFITYVLCWGPHRVNIRLSDDHARAKSIHRNTELLAFPGEGGSQRIDTGFRAIIGKHHGRGVLRASCSTKIENLPTPLALHDGPDGTATKESRAQVVVQFRFPLSHG